MLEAYKDFWQRYAEFNGLSSRSQFWYVMLANIIIGVILTIISRYLEGIYGLLTLIPGIAVTVRRLHDTNRSGWNLLLLFIPIVGFIVLLVFLIEASKPSKYI